MKKSEVTDIKESILRNALPGVVFDGWTWALIEQATQSAGYSTATARAVFPGGMPDVLDAFADLADREMLSVIADTDPESLRIRERVKRALLARFEFLSPHKEALRESVSFWASPANAARGAKILWRTADRIWDWAGDTATDYNRYTKRGLLSGVIAATTAAWLGDEQPGLSATSEFLDRRLENVITLGQGFGKVIGRFKRLRDTARKSAAVAAIFLVLGSSTVYAQQPTVAPAPTVSTPAVPAPTVSAPVAPTAPAPVVPAPAVTAATVFAEPKTDLDYKPGILDFFFPGLRKETYDPVKTLRAPFATGAADVKELVPDENGVLPVKIPGPEDTVPIDRQHHLNEEIVDWLKVKLSETLNFGVDTHAQDLKNTEVLFSPEGRAQYVQFLADFGVARALESGQYAVSSFVKDPPAVLTQGAAGGRYAWLLRTPVMLSFLQGDVTNYKDLRVQNQELQITVQVGRRENVPSPGVVIESWKAEAIAAGAKKE